MTIHICRPATLYIRGIRRCPDCKQVRRWVGFEQVWYGICSTCCGCGRSFDEEGHRVALPFKRGARREAIARARGRWPVSVGWRGPEARRWLDEQLRVT